MAGTTIVVGDVYDILRPGSATLRGRIVTALQATPLPHLWVEMLSDEFTDDPVLLVVGPGLILAPVAAPPPRSLNRPRGGRDWAGLIALILAITLALVLLITVVALLAFGAELSEEGGRLLTGVGLGLVAAVSAYLGSQLGRRGDDQ